MKLLKDKDGNVFKAHIIHSIPEGFEDISDAIVDVDVEGLSTEHLETVEIQEVPAIKEVIEHWTNGTDKVFDVNDIPTLTDENGDAFLDPSYSHVAAVSAVAKVPAHYRIKKTSVADQQIRQVKIDKLSVLRQSLLKEADIEINKIVDIGQDASALRTYRQALRDITEPFKKVNGDWKVSVDSLNVEEFTFPTKPQ